MTKQEAITAMKDGKKVTHRFFTDNEFIGIDGNRFYDEAGYKFQPAEFWMDRTGEAWNNDWSIFIN